VNSEESSVDEEEVNSGLEYWKLLGGKTMESLNWNFGPNASKYYRQSVSL
jgi:hypothetical protein